MNTTKITTKSGSVYTLREAGGGKFFLTADNKPNPYMEKIEGEHEVMVLNIPKVGERFIFWGAAGSPFQDSVRTSPVEKIEII